MKMIAKRVVKPLLSAATLLCVATAANAKADWVNELSPYIGADAQMRQMSWPQEAGGNLYQKNNVQGTVFGGIGINRYVGVEAGYSVTPFQESRRAILPGAIIFGNSTGAVPLTVPGNSGFVFVSKWQVKDWHVDILGYLPVSEEHHFDLVGGVGFAKTTIFQWTNLVSSDTATGAFQFNRTFTGKKGMLRLTAGVQHMVSECYGVRVLANWVNTSKFNYIHSQENVAGGGTTVGQWVLTRIKDSWSYGIGAFVKF